MASTVSYRYYCVVDLMLSMAVLYFTVVSWLVPELMLGILEPSPHSNSGETFIIAEHNGTEILYTRDPYT